MTEKMHRRPSEHQLPSELKDMRTLLFNGFESRNAVLRWLQQLAIRTLGQVPAQVYRGFSKEFKPDDNAAEGVLLAAFLTKEVRTRDMDDETAQNVREQWAAVYLTEMSEAAFKSLRKDAGEYVGTDSDESNKPDLGDIDVDDQPFAFRPALKDLDVYQRTALQRFLGGSLSNRREILNWSDDLVQATRSETIEHSNPKSFVRRLYDDPVGDLIISSSKPQWARERQVITSQYLLPAFNEAVQDLAKRTAEEISFTATPMNDEPSAWSGGKT